MGEVSTHSLPTSIQHGGSIEFGRLDKTRFAFIIILLTSCKCAKRQTSKETKQERFKNIPQKHHIYLTKYLFPITDDYFKHLREATFLACEMSISRSLHKHYILESTFAHIFLFLELTLQQETHIYINWHNLHTLLLLFLSSLDNYFLLLGHLKQRVQSRRTRTVLKIERHAQWLTRS